MSFILEISFRKVYPNLVSRCLFICTESLSTYVSLCYSVLGWVLMNMPLLFEVALGAILLAVRLNKAIVGSFFVSASIFSATSYFLYIIIYALSYNLLLTTFSFTIYLDECWLRIISESTDHVAFFSLKSIPDISYNYSRLYPDSRLSLIVL